MAHRRGETYAQPAQMKPSLHLSDEDVPGIGTLEVGSTVNLAVSGRVTGVQEERDYDDDGKPSGKTHRMVMVELTKIERPDHAPVKIGRL